MSTVGWHQTMQADTSPWAQTVKTQHIAIDTEGWIESENQVSTTAHCLAPPGAQPHSLRMNL